ncbi:MAG: hypothetical protein WC007_09135 [Pelobacteraceae bacterium]
MILQYTPPVAVTGGVYCDYNNDQNCEPLVPPVEPVAFVILGSTINQQKSEVETVTILLPSASTE